MGDCILPLPSVRFLCVAWPLKKHFAIAHRKELEFATLRPPSRKTPYPQGIVVIQGRRSVPPDIGPAPHFLRARPLILRTHTHNLSRRRAHRPRIYRAQVEPPWPGSVLHRRNKRWSISVPARCQIAETPGLFTEPRRRVHRLVSSTRIWPPASPLKFKNSVV